MKKHALMAVTMLSLVMVAVTSVNAQSSSRFIKVTIPFDFAIRDKTLPAGEYIVRRASSVKPEALLITSVDGGSVYILTSDVRAMTAQSESKLVFRQYGDRYFLSQIWTAEDNLGRELLKSHRERAREREMARDTTKRQTVTLIAHRK